MSLPLESSSKSRRLLKGSGVSPSLRAIHMLLFKMHRYGIIHPKRVLIPFLILAVLSFSQLPQLKTILSSDDMQEDGFVSVQRTQDIRQSYDERASATVLIGKTGGFSESELCQIQSFLNTQKSGNNSLLKVQSSLDLRRPRIFPNDRPGGISPILGYPKLLELNCFPPSQASVDFTQLQASPWDPFFSGLNHEVTLSFHFEDAESFKYGSFDPKVLDDLKVELASALSSISDVKTRWLGTAESMSQTLSGMKQSPMTNVYFSLILLIASRLAFGTWLSGLVLVGSLILSTMMTFGLKGLFHSPVDALSDSLFLMIGVASIEDFVFLSYLMRVPRMHWRRASRKLLLSTFLTSLTTFIGFASLTISNIHSIRALGFWAAVGALLEWVIVGILFPALLSYFYAKKPISWISPRKAPLLGGLEKLSFRSIPRKWAVAALGVLPVAFYAAFHIQTNDSILALFPKDNVFRQSVESVLSERGWAGSFSVVFESGVSTEYITDRIARLRKIPGVTQIESGLGALEYFKSDIPSLYHSAIDTEVRYSSQYKTYRDGEGRERILLYVNTLMLDEIAAIIAETEKVCAESRCFPAGSLVQQVELSREIPRTLIESMAVTLLIVGSVLVWICFATGQASVAISVVLASFWGPMLMLLAVVALGIPMNFLTSIFASVLLGIAGDNAIQFLMSERARGPNPAALAGADLLGGGAILCFSVMAVESLLFLLSAFSPPKTFGVLLFFGLFACLFGDLWIFRGLIHREKNSQKAVYEPAL